MIVFFPAMIVFFFPAWFPGFRESGNREAALFCFYTYTPPYLRHVDGTGQHLFFCSR